MKNPIIHISYSDLLNILYLFEFDNFTEIADTILNYSAGNNINSYIEYFNSSIAENLEADSVIVEKRIYLVLTTERINRGHIFNKQLKTNSIAYNQFKTLCKHIINFSNSFNISILDAAKFFISTGLDLMKNEFALSKYSYYYDQIASKYSNQLKLNQHKNDTNVLNIYNYYVSKIGKLKIAFNTDIELTVEFIYVNELIEKLNCDYKLFIDIQFEALKNTVLIPLPTLLYGPNAEKRFLANLKPNDAKTNSDTIPQWYKNLLNEDTNK